MAHKPHSLADPLIDEVRERRRQLFEACGNDLRELVRRIEELQAEHPEKLVPVRRLPPPREQGP